MDPMASPPDRHKRLTWLIVALLPFLFFAPLIVSPGSTLYSDSSDLISSSIPRETFLVSSWQQIGERPLWCPCCYSGEPFVHDIQILSHYPPHFILNVLPPTSLGMALSWLIVMHVLIAGAGTYVYVRSHQFSADGALVAATGFMFAGKWMLHFLTGAHYMYVGLAWLPWILWALESAIRRRNVAWATGAGCFIALLILGAQPQITFYACLFVGGWTFPVVLESDDRLKTAIWWIGSGAWAATIGVGLAMVQLLPTVEAAGHATRSLGVDSSSIQAAILQTIVFLIGPSLVREPHIVIWEDRAGFTILWLAVALAAPIGKNAALRYRAAFALVVVFYALGGAMLVQSLPGFSAFRQPSRMFLIAAFPVAYFAGWTTQHLWESAERAATCRYWLTRVAAFTLIVCGGFALRKVVVDGQTLPFHPYWISVLITVPAAYVVLGRLPALRWLWMVLLLADSWSLTLPYIKVASQAGIYAPSACVQYLSDPARPMGRVLDRDDADDRISTPLGGGATLALIDRLQAVRGYNSVDLLRYREYLQMIANSDAPIRPFESPLAYPIILNFPIENKNLLDLLNVRYLLQPADAALEHSGEWERVQTDDHPRAYNLGRGMIDFPPYVVYENRTVLPRAFVVHEAEQLPSKDRMLERFRAADFRQTVFLEGPFQAVANPARSGPREATIRQYSPNRIVIDVADGAPGWLVLGDLWFPGWQCTIDDKNVPVHRANYIFRAVGVPEGKHEVTFTFDPPSYRTGRRITFATLAIVALVVVVSLWRRNRALPATRNS